MADDHRDKLDAGEVTTELAEVQPDVFTIDWSKHLAGKLSDPVDTTVKRATLDKLAKAINTIPDGVELHPRLAKIYEDRRKMVAGEQPGAWGFPENLAYPTLLDERSGEPTSDPPSQMRHSYAVFWRQKKTP